MLLLLLLLLLLLRRLLLPLILLLAPHLLRPRCPDEGARGEDSAGRARRQLAPVVEHGARLGMAGKGVAVEGWQCREATR